MEDVKDIAKAGFLGTIRGRLTETEAQRLAEYEYGAGLPDLKVSTQLDRYYLQCKVQCDDTALTAKFAAAIKALEKPLLENDRPSGVEIEQVCKVLHDFVSGGLILTADGRSASYGHHGYHPKSATARQHGGQPWLEINFPSPPSGQ